MYPPKRLDSQALYECDVWSRRIELSLQSVVENLNGFDGSGGEPARQELLLVEQSLRVAAAALQSISG